MSRLLVVNIGNTSLFGGFFDGQRLTGSAKSLKIKGARELLHQLDALGLKDRPVAAIALCSVVPDLTRPVQAALERHTGAPCHLLSTFAEHGLRIAYENPKRLGLDRLAACIGARELYPDENLVVVDCGTATTVTALRKDGLLAGGAIIPGLSLWAESLAKGTAQLPLINLHKPRSPLGRSPEDAIASGLYHGHLGAIKQLSEACARKAFGEAPYRLLGTGGNASLYAREKLFTRIVPDIILVGLRAFAAKLKDHA